MAAAVSPPAGPVPRPRRRWFRRALAVAGLLILLLAIFYRPLGHWGIRYFGGGALAKAGLTGQWETSGTLLTGLKIDRLSLAGNDAAQLRTVTLRHAEVNYDLMALRGGGPGEVLKRLVVEDLDVDLDLTRPAPPSAASKKTGKPGAKPQLPSVVLPEIRISRVNVRIRMKEDTLLVRGFSLVLDPAGPGVIEAELLDLPGTPELRDVKGVTRVEPRRLILENTTLTPEAVIERLAVDLADLAKDYAAVELKVRQGPAKVDLQGSSSDWFGEVKADLKLTASGLSGATLAFWGVPDGGVDWEAGNLQAAVKGPVLDPGRLELSLDLTDGRANAADREVFPLTLRARSAEGRFNLAELTARSAGAELKASGETALPDSWEKIASGPGELKFALTVPDLAAQLPPGTGVTGKAEASGQLGFAEGKPGVAAAELKADGLIVQGVPVQSAEVKARTSAGIAYLDSALIRLNAQNTVTASGRMELEGEQAVSAQWKIEAQDLATVPLEVRSGLLWPSAGRVISEGTAAALLTGLKEGQWNSLQASASMDVTGLKLREAVLNSLSLQAVSEAGVARISRLTVDLDGINRLDASVALDLNQASRPGSAELALRLPDISKLSAWSTAFGGPALQGGKAELDWKGQGELSPLQGTSSGGLLAQGLKLDKVPEVLGISASVTQSGSEINVSGLKASAGPWRTEGSASWDGWHLTVPQLGAFAGPEKLASLEARVPWHGGTVPADSPLSLKLEVKDLDTARLATALGRELPVKGVLNAGGSFSGTLRTLEGHFEAAATRLQPGKALDGAPKMEPATVRLTADASKGRLTLDGNALQPPLQPLTLKAGIPADIMSLLADPGSAKNLPLSASVRLPASSLSFLPSWVPALRSLEGTAEADVMVTGTVGRPVWRGLVSARVPQASFVSSALPTVKDLNLRIRADERRVALEDATLLLAGGRLRAGGFAGLENPADPQLNFNLNAEEVLVVRDDNLSLRANAAIRCEGRLSRAAVRGTVDLVRGRVFKEIEFLPLSLPNDLPPPPPATTLDRQGAPSLPAPLDQWNFDIAIRTRDPVRLMGNVAKGNAVADLRLAGPGSKPELTGKIRLEEMWLKLPFSRLNITSGELSFVREAPFDPRIDITGESITGSRVVQVFVQGRALDPKVRLTSSPPLPEGEIAALLATGVTTSDLTSSGDEAAGRAAFVLLKQTYRKLFRKNDVDSDDDEPPRLSFDFSVFGTDPSKRGVSAIYELNPRWRLIGRVGETGTFRGLLHYLIRFR